MTDSAKMCLEFLFKVAKIHRMTIIWQPKELKKINRKLYHYEELRLFLDLTQLDRTIPTFLDGVRKFGDLGDLGEYASMTSMTSASDPDVGLGSLITTTSWKGL